MMIALFFVGFRPAAANNRGIIRVQNEHSKIECSSKTFVRPIRHEIAASATNNLSHQTGQPATVQAALS